MKVAVTSRGPEPDSEIDPRFGRAKYFIIFDRETDEVVALDNTQNLNALQGAGIQAARNVIDAGAKALITGNVGPKAFATLKAGGVEVCLGADGTVRDMVEQYEAGRLRSVDKPSVTGHWV